MKVRPVGDVQVRWGKIFDAQSSKHGHVQLTLHDAKSMMPRGFVLIRVSTSQSYPEPGDYGDLSDVVGIQKDGENVVSGLEEIVAKLHGVVQNISLSSEVR